MTVTAVRTLIPVPAFTIDDMMQATSPDPLEIILTCEEQDERQGSPSGTSLDAWLRQYKEAH